MVNKSCRCQYKKMASRVSSASSEESFWNGQKENLKKIREILGHSAHSRSSPISTVYRKSRPSYLPKFGWSPNSPTLRGSKYHRVPPLPLKSPNARYDGYDSWGDDNGDSESEELVLPSRRRPLGHFPAFLSVGPNGEQRLPQAPLKGVLQSTQNRSHENLPKKKVTYRSSPIYLIREASKPPQEPKLLNRKHPNGISNSNKSDPFDPTSNPILARYLPNSYSDVWTADSRSKHAAEYLTQNPDFLSRFVDQLVDEFLEEELVPDLLIEFYRNEESRTTPELKYIHSLEPAMLKSSIKTPRVPPHKDTDYLKGFLNTLVNEVINEECQLIARSAGREMATELLEKMAIYDVIMEMVTEEMLQTGDYIVDEALQEVMLEDLLDEMLIEPEVQKQSKEVTMETLNQYSNRRRQKEIQQIDKSVGQRMEEEMCLDYLLKLTTRQGQLWTKEQYADRILDDMVTSILLDQYYDVKRRRKATIDNVPLRRLHEKMATDTALECLLSELSKHLDEDMADLDQYEQGVQQNIHSWLASKEATPV